jgi:hypothetical protein
VQFKLIITFYLEIVYIQIQYIYYDRAREFNDPNFGFSESCTKKNALNKLAIMSRVIHNAKSIENSSKCSRNCLKYFAHSTKVPAILKRIKQTEITVYPIRFFVQTFDCSHEAQDCWHTVLLDCTVGNIQIAK